MSWRDVVRDGLTRFGLVDQVRVARHWVRTGGGRTDRRLVAEHFEREAESPRLHLGCGTRMLDGWLNSDYSPRSKEAIRLDAAAPLPFDDDAFALVYCEHMIEHLDHPDAVRLVGEVRRVLRPGGRFRVATPDLDRLLDLFDDDGTRSQTARRYVRMIIDRHVPGVDPDCENPVFVLNNNVREWGHRFLYDEPTLRGLLTDAGFVEVERFGLQESRAPELAGLAHDARLPDGLVDFETMTFEAVAP